VIVVAAVSQIGALFHGHHTHAFGVKTHLRTALQTLVVIKKDRGTAATLKTLHVFSQLNQVA
jgi:hypothetical protein